MNLLKCCCQFSVPENVKLEMKTFLNLTSINLQIRKLVYFK